MSYQQNFNSLGGHMIRDAFCTWTGQRGP